MDFFLNSEREREAARAALVQLLAKDDELVDELLQIVEVADMAMHMRRWRQHPKVKQIRSAAADLARSLDSLSRLEFLVVGASSIRCPAESSVAGRSPRTRRWIRTSRHGRKNISTIRMTHRLVSWCVFTLRRASLPKGVPDAVAVRRTK
jgi:hypothetical protein